MTRTADDFYAAFDRDILIKTKFCSVRAFQEKALLRSDLFGELVFMDGTRCSVDTVYVRKRLRWGTHKVTVTREEEGIYSLAGSETLLFASRCSTLALRDEAVLEMQDSLSGILHLHGGTCRVEGVFEAISYGCRAPLRPGRSPGRDGRACPAAPPGCGLVPPVDGGLRKRKSRRRQVCDGFFCSGTRSRA